MNFSKLKLNESIAKGDYTGLSAQKATSGLATASSQNKFNRNNEVKAAKTKLSSQPVGTKNSQQTVMSSHTPDVDKYFAEMRAEVERIKTLQAQKSDWRSELQEKAVDGVEREQHPYVTVMPTGDEALIQAMKQMGGEAQEKKKKLQSAGVEVNLQKEETLDEVAPIIAAGGKLALGLGKAALSGAVGGALSGAGSAIGGVASGAGSAIGGIAKAASNNKTKKSSTTTQSVEEAIQLEEKKKKGCKDGYKRDENGNCVKKEKSKTYIVGRGWGYGHHHHHDHDETPDSEGGGGDGGGDGGGGMGEMFDILGDMLLKEKLETGKEYHARMKKKAQEPINPTKGMKNSVAKANPAKPARMVNQTPKINVTGDMTKAVGKPRLGSSD
jgi:predicted transcriptional regulator